MQEGYHNHQQHSGTAYSPSVQHQQQNQHMEIPEQNNNSRLPSFSSLKVRFGAKSTGDSRPAHCGPLPQQLNNQINHRPHEAYGPSRERHVPSREQHSSQQQYGGPPSRQEQPSRWSSAAHTQQQQVGYPESSSNVRKLRNDIPTTHPTPAHGVVSPSTHNTNPRKRKRSSSPVASSPENQKRRLVYETASFSGLLKSYHDVHSSEQTSNTNENTKEGFPMAISQILSEAQEAQLQIPNTLALLAGSNKNGDGIITKPLSKADDRLRSMSRVLMRQSKLLRKALDDLAEYKRKESLRNRISDPSVNITRDSEFLTLFASDSPVAVMSKELVWKMYTESVEFFDKGTFFCNRAYAALHKVPLGDFTHPKFCHKNIGAWKFIEAIRNPQVIQNVRFLLHSGIQHIEYKMPFEDRERNMILCDCHVRVGDLYIWYTVNVTNVFHSGLFLDGEVAIEGKELNSIEDYNSPRTVEDVDLEETYKEKKCAAAAAKNQDPSKSSAAASDSSPKQNSMVSMSFDNLFGGKQQKQK